MLVRFFVNVQSNALTFDDNWDNGQHQRRSTCRPHYRWRNHWTCTTKTMTSAHRRSDDVWRPSDVKNATESDATVCHSFSMRSVASTQNAQHWESDRQKEREINSPIQPCAQTIKHSMPALKQTGQSYSPGGSSVQPHPTRHNIVDFDTRVFLLRLTINCKKTSSSSTFILGSVFSNHVAVYRDYR